MAAIFSPIPRDSLCIPLPNIHTPWPISPIQSFKSAKSVPFDRHSKRVRRPSVFSISSDSFLPSSNENRPSLSSTHALSWHAPTKRKPLLGSQNILPHGHSSPLSLRNEKDYDNGSNGLVEEASSTISQATGLVQVEQTSRDLRVEDIREGPSSSSESIKELQITPAVDLHATIPFKKWVSSFKKRQLTRRQTLSGPSKQYDERQQCNSRVRSRSSSSLSSMYVVTKTMSATYSQASPSFTQSTRIGAASRRLRSNTRTSGLSGSDYRRSIDSSSAALDPTVLERAQKRKRIIDEIITTEEAYLVDLKVFENVRNLDPHFFNR